MPLFRPRTRTEILRAMISRVVARSSLVGILRNSVVFHVLAAAADEDAEQYFQLAKLRRLFDIDKATGSDLDDRAAEIKPSLIKRRKALFASGEVQFGRQGTTGNLAIAAGTVVAAEDAEGQIKFRTTSNATILAGNTTVSAVPVVALEAGSRGNVAGGAIVQLVSRIPGVTSVTNVAAFSNGQDRESDPSFRARLKLFVQGLSRGTKTAIKSFSLNVQLTDGRRVLFANVVEPLLPTGDFDVYIDDGTGSVDEFDETYLSSDDILINPALGGELNIYTTERPVRDDGSFELRINAVLQTRGTDYELNSANGQVELLAPLTVGDNVTARYRYYTGLIQETQRVIDGDPATLVTHPGVRAAGTRALVKPAAVVFQTLSANVSVRSDFDVSNVISEVRAILTAYINGLDIGESVIVSEIIERAMSITGMSDFQISDLSGTFPAVNQTILPNQVARIIASSLNIS